MLNDQTIELMALSLHYDAVIKDIQDDIGFEPEVKEIILLILKGRVHELSHWADTEEIE